VAVEHCVSVVQAPRQLLPLQPCAQLTVICGLHAPPWLQPLARYLVLALHDCVAQDVLGPG
jgi:hypothetical protein